MIHADIPPLVDLAPIRLVVFDWAGTLIDYGSRAPAGVFVEVFRREGVDVTLEQARGPMGMAKRDHIVAIGTLPEVAAAWRAKHGAPMTDADVDRMYDAFLPLQAEAIRRHADIIPGAIDVVEQLREQGIRIGSSTGYSRALASICAEEAGQGGLTTDTVVSADDVPAGRPAPWMIHENMRRLNVYPPAAVVKVDDTVPGIEAARAAGCWAVGVTMTGNGLGLSEEEVDRLPVSELAALLNKAADQFCRAGAHFVVESVAGLPEIVARLRELASSHGSCTDARCTTIVFEGKLGQQGFEGAADCEK